MVNTHVDLILHHRNRIGSFGLVHSVATLVSLDVS